MTVVAYLVGVLVFAAGVGLSIALHEVGHLVPAKKFGVRVTQYMVGFGPTLWSRRRGETEYGIKAIPLGGFIRMIGMFPPRKGDDPGTVRVSSTGRFTGLMDEARRNSLEEIRPGDEDRVFYKLPAHRKIIIMLGGPLMNLLIAAVLLTIFVTVYGLQEVRPGATIASVAQCVKTVEEAKSDPSCANAPAAPAAAAGVRPGDEVVSINGTPVTKLGDISRLIRPQVGKPVALVVSRDGTERTVTVTPIRNELPAYDDKGQPILDKQGRPTTIQTGYIGVTSSPNTAVVPQPLSAVPGYLGEGLARTASAIVRIPERMVGVWHAAVGDEERDIESPMSVVGVGRVAGDVTSGKLDSLVGETTADKAWFLVNILASLNLMLFVFNLVPLLPLDGGHIAGATWEGIKRTGSRLLGRPDPGPVDVAKALPVAYAVSIALLAMSVLLIYADLVNPINLGG